MTLAPADASNKVNADDLLFSLGSPGRFQIIQFILFVLQFIPISMNDLMPIFYNIRPDFYTVNGVNFSFRAGYNNSAFCSFPEHDWGNVMYYYGGRRWSIIADVRAK